MGRVILLSCVSFVLAIAGFNYGYGELLLAQAGQWSVDKGSFSFAIWIFVYLCLTGISALSVVSSIMIFFLVFLAIRPENDGTFVISRDNLYGRIFLRITELNQGEFSYCQIFWQTNGALFIFSFIISFIGGYSLFFWKYYSWKDFGAIIFGGLWAIGAVVGSMLAVLLLAYFIHDILWLRVLQNTQFSSIYRKYLCPRLKIK